MRGVNLAAAVQLQSWTMRNMNAEGGMHEEGRLKWPPLRPGTIARRLKIGKWPGPMLQVNARLIGSFEASASNRQGRVQNRVPYARYHEEGTRKMAQRKLFPTEKQGLAIVLPVYEEFVRRAIE
jgi:hypothetical protein